MIEKFRHFSDIGNGALVIVLWALVYAFTGYGTSDQSTTETFMETLIGDLCKGAGFGLGVLIATIYRYKLHGKTWLSPFTGILSIIFILSGALALLCFDEYIEPLF